MTIVTLAVLTRAPAAPTIFEMRPLTVSVLLCALLACKSSKKTETTPEPCADQPKKPTLDLFVCSDTGGAGSTELAHRDGTTVGVLAASTRVVRLYGAGDQPEERKRNDATEVRVCVLNGPRAGNYGYVPSTRIFGRPCE